MKEFNIKFKGIVDKERNPFSSPSWCKEHRTVGELGSGKPMQPSAIENFQKVLEKGGLIENIREPHREKYATFQAIRWGYAIVVEGNKVVPTKRWYEISPKTRLNIIWNRNLNLIDKQKNEKVVIIHNHSKPKSVSLILEEAILVDKLKNFDLTPVVTKYLDNENLRNRTPNEIIRKFTFGMSISRAFHSESPSIQFNKWALKIDGNEIVKHIKQLNSQSDYDEILFEISTSLLQSWKPMNEKGLKSKMNIGIALKINNLMMKHLVFVNFSNRIDLVSFLHVPWDKFTLQPLKKIWVCNPKIEYSSSQGFVKTKKQYLELHDFITKITQKAGVNRINYEFWAWDKEH